VFETLLQKEKEERGQGQGQGKGQKGQQKQPKVKKKSGVRSRTVETLDALWSAKSSTHGLADRSGGGFFVTVPCLRGSKNLGGTRLTLLRDETGVADDVSCPCYTLTIRTPQTPERFEEFERVLDEKLRRVLEVAGEEGGEGKGGEYKRTVVEKGLEVYYYAICLSPLTRGGAACTWGMLLGIWRVAGLWTGEGGLIQPPSGKQLDWEAILAESVGAFVGEFAQHFDDLLVARGEEADFDFEFDFDELSDKDRVGLINEVCGVLEGRGEG